MVLYSKINGVKCLKILKYRKSPNGKYKLTLDNDRDISLYEEVILEYKLLLNKVIDDNLLIELDKRNQEYDVYYVALKALNSRIRSVEDLRQLLKRKEYPIEMIENAIKKLLDQGYLNDRSYAKSFINNQIITTNNGPYKIKRLLFDKKISESIIDEEMVNFTESEQRSKINKIIMKGLKSNNSRGGIVLKQKIYNDLKLLGYDSVMINDILNNYEFSNNYEIAKKEYDKLYRKYSKKYTGYELERIIKDKLYQKGLKYEEE